MASINADVHVGDVGTVYQVPCYDSDLVIANFDPSAATVKQIVFRMPSATGFVLLTRTATPAQITINGASVWCLTYTVLAADVVAYVSGSVGGFHQAPGALRLEGYVQFSAAQKWTSSFVYKDQMGNPLAVKARLSA